MGNEAFYEFNERQRLRRASTTPSSISSTAGAVGATLSIALGERERLRRDATQRLNALDPNTQRVQKIKKWWADSNSRIAEWGNDYLAGHWKRLGIGSDRSAWAQANNLPALRGYYAYELARIAMTVGEGYSNKSGDTYDGMHYASACYADFFVASDDVLRQTVNHIPDSPVTMLSFEEFALHLGIAPC